MAVETYAVSTLGKMSLAVLAKANAVSVAAFALTLGTVVTVVVAGAALVVKTAGLENSDLDTSHIQNLKLVEGK